MEKCPSFAWHLSKDFTKVVSKKNHEQKCYISGDISKIYSHSIGEVGTGEKKYSSWSSRFKEPEIKSQFEGTIGGNAGFSNQFGNKFI